MALTELNVSGYRSLRRLNLKLRRINVLSGPAGCGKSSLYNSLRLMRRAAGGRLAVSIAAEGGMESVLWAGVRKHFGKREEQRVVRLGIRSEAFAYELDVGTADGGPPETDEADASVLAPVSRFALNPEVKRESLWMTTARKGRIAMMSRRGPLASLRNGEGRMAARADALDPAESVLAQMDEPHLYPELSAIARALAGWRFYDHFPTGKDAPLRLPQPGVKTTALSEDGRNLAAAIETIIETGDAELLREEVARTFSGGRLEVVSEGSRFRLVLHRPGLLRPLQAVELSEAVLGYLCVAAVLLSPRLPGVLGLKEPETGLHPDWTGSLARLVKAASNHTQLWITTQSELLAKEIERISGETAIRLAMVDGETRLA